MPDIEREQIGTGADLLPSPGKEVLKPIAPSAPGASLFEKPPLPANWLRSEQLDYELLSSFLLRIDKCQVDDRGRIAVGARLIIRLQPIIAKCDPRLMSAVEEILAAINEDQSRTDVHHVDRLSLAILGLMAFMNYGGGEGIRDPLRDALFQFCALFTESKSDARKTDALKQLVIRFIECIDATRAMSSPKAYFAQPTERQEIGKSLVAVASDFMVCAVASEESGTSAAEQLRERFDMLLVNELWPASAPAWFERSQFDWPGIHRRLTQRSDLSQELIKCIENRYPEIVSDANRVIVALADNTGLSSERLPTVEPTNAPLTDDPELAAAGHRVAALLGPLKKGEATRSDNNSQSFMEAEELFLSLLYVRSKFYRREAIAERFQAHLTLLQGADFGTHNKAWAEAVNQFLCGTMLRLNCMGKKCPSKATTSCVPSLLRYRDTRDRDGKVRWVFSTEHLDSLGKSRHHGGTKIIPPLTVIQISPDFSKWRLPS